MSEPDPKNEATPEDVEEVFEEQPPTAEEEHVEPEAAGLNEEQLEALRAERDTNRDKWLRAEAELDNYRKRAQRDADEIRKYQSIGLVRDLLSGLDNLRRAEEAAAKSKNVDELLKGISMVSVHFENTLKAHGIERIEAEGQPFDPNFHEAVTQIPSEHPAMTVITDYEPGYKLHDRVIRPSKVVVSSGPAEAG